MTTRAVAYATSLQVIWTAHHNQPMPAHRKSIKDRRRLARAPGKDAAGRPLGVPVSILEPVNGVEVPEPPDGLGGDGLEAWGRLWRAGAG